jgi:hypothetical protein
MVLWDASWQDATQSLPQAKIAGRQFSLGKIRLDQDSSKVHLMRYLLSIDLPLASNMSK